MKNKQLIISTILCVSFLFGYTQSKKIFMSDHIIVKFKDGVLDKELLKTKSSLKYDIKQLVKDNNLKEVLKSKNGKTLRKVVRNSSPEQKISISRINNEITIPDFYNLMYLEIEPDTDIVELCKQLNGLSFIEYAEPDYIMKDDQVTTNDPEFAIQIALDYSGNSSDINWIQAWTINSGSSNIRVGVIDSGIDYDNPDLGNGNYGAAGDKVADGWNYFLPGTNPDDEWNWRDGHGTKVAGIIGAFTNNGIGVSGIAGGNGSSNTGVTLIALRVGDGVLQIDRPVGQVIDAIYDASISTSQGGFGCHIINHSGSVDVGINSLRKAVSFAAQNNVVFVNSKGNESNDDFHYPSDFDDNLVISVGASTFSNTLASFSNFGNDMDFLAPGTSATVITTNRLNQGDDYIGFNGTSAAAPVAAGVAALILSQRPDLHRDDVENLLEISAFDLGDAGYDELTGHGRIDAGEAMTYLASPWSLTHHSTTGGNSVKKSDNQQIIFRNDAGIPNGLAEGLYFADKYEVTKTVNLPSFQCENFVWTRTSGATRGWSGANPNNEMDYSLVVSRTNTTVTLRTFVYYVEYTSGAQQIKKWYPTSPQNVRMEYTTLGIPGTPIPDEVVGASIVCTSNTTYSFNGSVPAGATINWTASPASYFTNSTGSGTSFITKALNSTVSGSATITATITTSGCENIIVKEVQVGKFGNGQVSVSGTNAVCATENYYFYCEVPGGHQQGYSYQWTVPPSWTIYSQTNNGILAVPYGTDFAGQILAKVNNGCGWSDNGSIVVYPNYSCGGGYYYSVFPNPANQELTINSNFQNNSQGSESLSFTNTPKEVKQKEKSGFGYSLYDMTGQLKIKSETNEENVIINTSELKPGIYQLRIETNGQEVETHNVVIDH